MACCDELDILWRVLSNLGPNRNVLNLKCSNETTLSLKYFHDIQCVFVYLPVLAIEYLSAISFIHEWCCFTCAHLFYFWTLLWTMHINWHFSRNILGFLRPESKRTIRCRRLRENNNMMKHVCTVNFVLLASRIKKVMGMFFLEKIKNETWKEKVHIDEPSVCMQKMHLDEPSALKGSRVIWYYSQVCPTLPQYSLLHHNW